MTSKASAAWRETAWNGVRFKAPPDWTPAEIGPRRLLLEDGSGPVMEIKWDRAPAYAPAKQMRRLEKAQQKGLGKNVRSGPTPESWKKALARYETDGFAWSADSRSGQGVMVFCRRCSSLSLIQFFRPESDGFLKVSERILGSFRDHAEKGVVLWAVFDFRAEIPEVFELKTKSFKPGRFELSFAHGRRSLNLDRFGPASVLLRDVDLVGFARQNLDPPSGDPALVEDFGLETREWNIGPKSKSGLEAWRDKLRRVPAHRRLRIWRDEAANRIFSVGLEGSRPLDSELFEQVCAGYENVD